VGEIGLTLSGILQLMTRRYHAGGGTLRSAWTICARVARKMRLLMLALCAITISACGRLPATVPAGLDSREA
jgi:hypothetical protein